MIRMRLRAAFSALALASCAAVITGCGANLEPASLGTAPGTLGTIKGTAFGGQQPISGAHVYVFAVGTGGYGTAATSLLTSTNGTGSDSIGYYVTTDSNGAFTIASSVSCTAGLSAYLYAYGGNPQLTSNSPTNNTASGLLAPLGTCTGTAAPPSGTTSVNISEVSTVVTAYALAGFATDATHISAANTTLAKTGVKNAMATALNIVNSANGTVGSTTNNSVGKVPTDKINALADILASCVNSSGPSSANCVKLFTNTSTSTDTAAAAIAIAHSPFYQHRRHPLHAGRLAACASRRLWLARGLDDRPAVHGRAGQCVSSIPRRLTPAATSGCAAPTPPIPRSTSSKYSPSGRKGQRSRALTRRAIQLKAPTSIWRSTARIPSGPGCTGALITSPARRNRLQPRSQRRLRYYRHPDLRNVRQQRRSVRR